MALYRHDVHRDGGHAPIAHADSPHVVLAESASKIANVLTNLVQMEGDVPTRDWVTPADGVRGGYRSMLSAGLLDERVA